ncbi:ABC transporter ATP-binding protein [Saccharopolyspora sp. K220]|uniref:ABC transporter ATP-binding protein n=1 Tax=Saccharopolyspora soli TaxID=2926618 RepID=UPI001F576DE9|nr:ABC transporter ATP-binding protein [Saccharopolyspora soli]MCI2417402.1 ABC transporter ATP-binding protein [Saccharopolyspora soli]
MAPNDRLAVDERAAEPAEASASTAAGVVVSHVSKTFGSKQRVDALSDVSFEVAAGEIVALTGHSGCGKTTLLRIIMGLETATSGTVTVGGRPVDGCDPKCGIVFQHAELLPWRTARGNVEFGLQARGMGRAERREVADRCLELVGLSHAADRRPDELSGGMRQRVGIARALAIDPELLLMDEPFSALDAQTRETMQAELLDIQERTGKTIIFVSHDLDESVLLADRVVAMLPNPGRVQEVLDTSLDRSLPIEQRRGSTRFMQRRHELYQLIHGKRDLAPEEGSR